MSKDKIRDLVDSVDNENYVAADKIFNDLMAAKVAPYLETARKLAAKDLFGQK